MKELEIEDVNILIVALGEYKDSISSLGVSVNPLLRVGEKLRDIKDRIEE